MERRKFLSGACKICILGVSGIAALEACSPAAAKDILKPSVKNNKILIPLRLFEDKTRQIISPLKSEYEIAVEKRDNNTYRALLLKCTHYENPLVVTADGFVCTAHGSKFTKDGKVLKGPAADHLNELKTDIVQSNLVIHLPAS
jgi:Rieske Fe-S protein